MKHLFVPYELAVLAKEKGFDEECFGTWDIWDERNPPRLLVMTYPYYLGQEYAKRFHKTCIIAPLYQQLIDWLHLKGFNLHDYWLPDDKQFGCDVYDTKGNLLFSDLVSFNGGKYNTKQEAWNKALEEAFKLI